MGWPFSDYVTDRAHEAADELAMRLGIPTPPLAWLAFAAQISNETRNGDPNTVGVLNANPFNITTGGGRFTYPGQITGEAVSGGSIVEHHSDFALFGSPSSGARAGGYFYSAEADPAGFYAKVRQAFVGGDPVAISRAIEQSPFATGHYSYALTPVVERAEGSSPTPVVVDAAIVSPPAQRDFSSMAPISPIEVLGGSATASAIAGGFTPMRAGGSLVGGILTAPARIIAGKLERRVVIFLFVVLVLIILVELL